MVNGGAVATYRRGRARIIVSALLITTALVPATGVAPVFAQTAARQGRTDLASKHVFAIKAQPMTRALTQFGVQSGLQVTVNGALIRGVNAPAANGEMSAERALGILLTGSGLTYDIANDGTIVIISVIGTTLNEGAVLDPVRVVADGEKDSHPENAITDSFVAPRSLTGSKTDTPVLDDSVAVSVITQKEMQTRNVQDVQQVVAYTAGVQSGEYGSDVRYDYVRLRGFYSSLSTYRDGLSSRNYNFTTARQEPYGLQQVDVLKGSTSSLFGMNGPGGLVNLVTKRPQDEAGGEVFTTFGENHLTVGEDVTGPVAKDSHWTYRLTGMWQNAERHQDYSQDDRLYIAPAFTYKPKAGTELTILTSYSERESNLGYGFPTGIETSRDAFLANRTLIISTPRKLILATNFLIRSRINCCFGRMRAIPTSISITRRFILTIQHPLATALHLRFMAIWTVLPSITRCNMTPQSTKTSRARPCSVLTLIGM
tara:strand:+ start:127344 stop:128798 length:1455 start_codon:yes stop_codon:yes gene_type:complete